MKTVPRKRVDARSVVFTLIAVFLIATLLLQPVTHAANTFPGQYELVSINNTDGTGVDRSATVADDVSYDGSKILFETTATNLTDAPSIPGNNAGYIRDMNTNTTVRVDKSQSGVLADGACLYHVMSETGRYVVFQSDSTNLIDGTVYSSAYRTYIKDMQTGVVQVANPVVDSSSALYEKTRAVSISNDGRYLVFTTTDVNRLIPGTRPVSAVYYDAVLYDAIKNSWTLLNQPLSGPLQNVITSPVTASCDGSIILLTSYATNLAPGYSGSYQHLYLADIRNGLTITDITPGAIGGGTFTDISCNGRYVIYRTSDRVHISPTPAGVGASTQVVRYDRLTGEKKYVSSKSDGSFSTQGAFAMSVSDSGDVLEFIHTFSSGGFAQYTVQLKHLSDGSGTLESVQGDYPLQLGEGGVTGRISPNGKYVIVSSKDSSVLGVPGSQDSSGKPIHNIIRIKTGL